MTVLHESDGVRALMIYRESMRILVLVPARGGSKRLPGKNTLILGGKPLISWSIDCAKNTPHVCDILVSTDDLSIATIAKSNGALVPWLRPEVLASDTASSVDVCMHALDWYEAEHGVVDALLLLQPTSPFRKRSTVIKAIDLFLKNRRPVVAVMRANSHPMWCMKINGDRLSPYIEGAGLHLRSQDLPPAFSVTGGLYLISPNDLRRGGTFFTSDTQPVIVETFEESIDIDTVADWHLAQALLPQPTNVEC